MQMNGRQIFVTAIAMLLVDSDVALAEGIYAGVGLGSVHIREESSGISDVPIGRNLLIGLQTSPTISFEALFLRSNLTDQNTQLSDTRARFSGVAVYGASSTPSGERGRVLARLGLFAGNREIISSARTIDTSRGGFALGLGYALDLNERFSLRGDFDTFLLSGFDRLSSLTLGVQVRFGD